MVVKPRVQVKLQIFTNDAFSPHSGKRKRSLAMKTGTNTDIVLQECPITEGALTNTYRIKNAKVAEW